MEGSVLQHQEPDPTAPLLWASIPLAVAAIAAFLGLARCAILPLLRLSLHRDTSVVPIDVDFSDLSAASDSDSDSGEASRNTDDEEEEEEDGTAKATGRFSCEGHGFELAYGSPVVRTWGGLGLGFRADDGEPERLDVLQVETAGLAPVVRLWGWQGVCVDGVQRHTVQRRRRTTVRFLRSTTGYVSDVDDAY